MIWDAIHKYFRQSILSYRGINMVYTIELYLFVQILDPLFQLILFCLIAKYIHGTSDITFWVIGNSFILCAKSSVSDIGIISVCERFWGTLKLIVAVPANKFAVFTSRAFIYMFHAILKVIIGLAAGVLLFGVSFAGVSAGLFAINLIIGVFAASALGILICNIGLRVRDMNIVLNTATTILLVVTGANFPVDKLPVILQYLSYVMPLTRSIKAANLIMNSASFNMVSGLMLQEFIIGIIYLAAGYLSLQYMENLARKSASLDIY